MTAKITKMDVFRYFANKLDRTRRRELEAACQSNEQIRRWFQELTPTEEELQRQPRPQGRLDPQTYRNLAASAYLGVERDERAERVRQWLEWIRNGVTAVKSAIASLHEIVPSELLEGVRGTLLYREPVPQTLSCDPHTFSVPPQEVPRIYPDYGSGRLIIRQALASVPSGAVEVRVVRRRGEEEIETFPPKRIPLERAEPPKGEPYWYAEVPLKMLIDEFRPGDDIIYCVEAAPNA
jgi:hypothetical protein